MFVCYVFISSTVPPPTVTISPSGPIEGAMVGNFQMMECRVSTVRGVELSSVMISWIGPGEDTTINNSRMTISPTSSSDNNYTSSIQFTYLMEGDNGTYMCNVSILTTSEVAAVELEALEGESFALLLVIVKKLTKTIIYSCTLYIDG